MKSYLRIIMLLIVVVIVSNVIMSCASRQCTLNVNDIAYDRNNIEEPGYREYNYVSDGIYYQFTKQIGQALDISRQIRFLTDNPIQAFNVDSFDEVPNSSWFTNRNGMHRMSMDQIAKGPDENDGPDITSKWTITRAKTEGVTPGFTIRDKRGDYYVIKFDPIGYSELVTGAEVVSTKLFYACGYNTPQNSIVYFHADSLILADDVSFIDEKGRKRNMTLDDLNDILDRIQISADGSIRAMASKYIPGIPKGPFNFEGVRKDDPNDLILHQHRRELRGLRIISAWLNHVDTKSGNSYDSYVEEDEAKYIRHYLIDFGSTLGSAARGPMEPQTGFANQMDAHDFMFNTLFAGVYIHDFEKNTEVKYPSIGLFHDDIFHPGKFKFYVPNPAFENCTDRDGFWGAKIVMSFTDEQLQTIVNEGKYSNPEAAEYLVEILKKRRDLTGEYWYSRINPLDRFMVELLPSDKGMIYVLKFDDLAIEGNLKSKENTSYIYDLYLQNGSVVEKNIRINVPSIELPGKNVLKDYFGSKDNKTLIYSIRTKRTDEKLSTYVKVFLSYEDENSQFTLSGIKREE